MNASTTYGNGGVTTQTSVDPYPGLDNHSLLSFAKRMVASRQQQPDPVTMRAPAPAPMARGAERSATGLDMAEQNAKLAQLKAISGTAPMKYSYPIGSAGHLEIDDRAMTGAQRQAFLPQSAGMTGPMGPSRASQDGPPQIERTLDGATGALSDPNTLAGERLANNDVARRIRLQREQAMYGGYRG